MTPTSSRRYQLFWRSPHSPESPSGASTSSPARRQPNHRLNAPPDSPPSLQTPRSSQPQPTILSAPCWGTTLANGPVPASGMAPMSHNVNLRRLRLERDFRAWRRRPRALRPGPRPTQISSSPCSHAPNWLSSDRCYELDTHN